MNKKKRKHHAHPILIIGAGRGGSALLEMFLDDRLVEVVAVADPDPAAPGLKLAMAHGIPVYADAVTALRACEHFPDCIVYNLTHDDTVADEVNRVFGRKNTISGLEAKLFWQMVTNMKRVKAELEKSQSQLLAIIRHVMDGIIMISATGEILGFNPAAEKIFGYTQQEILGKNVSLLMPEPYKSEHDSYLQRYILTGVAGEQGILGIPSREVEAVKKNGKHFPMELSVSEMPLKDERYFVGVFRDITERKLTEQKIEHLAHHDYLTGLPNRALLLDRLKQAISLAKRGDRKTAVLFLDLDSFKQVNDTLGHQTGDLLLQEAASRLKNVVRSSDTVARAGGDEFIFVLNDVGSHENASLAAKNIIAALSEPFALAGKTCRVGGSIGISIFPDDALDSGMLLIQADEAMYAAKRNGKNSYKFYRDISG